MNTSIRGLTGAVLVMIVLLLGNLTYVQFWQADALRTNPHNTQRTLRDEYSRLRGQISAGGVVLANSVPSDNQYRFRRQYPNDPLMYGHLTGYYTLYSTRTGIEEAYDSILNGSDDRLFGSRLADLISGRDPRGGNVELTIDPRVQTAAYNGLTAGVGRGAFVGGAAAIRPSTGEVLALVSTPGFDPNPLSAQDSATVNAADESLRTDPAKPAESRATGLRFPPGSTFKVVTTAAALESGMTPTDQVTAASSIVLEGTRTSLTNYGSTHCGPGGGATTDLRTAFAYSCNTAFVEISPRIGNTRFVNTAKAFGVGEDLDFTLPLAASTVGAIPDTAALQQSSIGQRDVSLTPLQNAVIAATVANGGLRMKPQLLRSLQGPDLKPLVSFRPVEVTQAIRSETAATLQDLMLDAERTDGGGGKLPGLRIASKTGTAEHGSGGAPPYTWYIAFSPGHDIAVSVAVISGPGLDSRATGGRIAGPIGRAMIAAVAGTEGGR